MATLCSPMSARPFIASGVKIKKTHQGELWLAPETLGRLLSELTNPKTAHDSDPEAKKQVTLTARERKIVHMIVEASSTSNKALAERLFTAEHTLRNHLASICDKLGGSNRLVLYIYATKHPLKKSLS